MDLWTAAIINVRKFSCNAPVILVRYSNPITGLDRPLGFQVVEAPRLLDNRHMKVVRLSALRTGRLYPPGDILGTRFCYRLSLPQGHSAAGRINSKKNSNAYIHTTCRYMLCIYHVQVYVYILYTFEYTICRYVCIYRTSNVHNSEAKSHKGPRSV